MLGGSDRPNPLRQIEDFFEEVESMVNNARGVRTDRRGNEYVIEFDAPGFGKDDLDVNVEEHMLRVSGQTMTETGERSLDRPFPLHGDFRTDETTAEYKNGVLVVRIPVGDEDSGHSVDVN